MYISFKIHHFTSLYPPKAFNTECVTYSMISQKEALKLINRRKLAPSDWENYGFAWVGNFIILINMNKYKKVGYKNNMSKIWKDFVSFNNINRFLRKEKLKNI